MHNQTTLPENFYDGLIQMELTVKNHAGVMSHICNLFSRRGCNVEAILCMPKPDGTNSTICLLLHENGRIPQMKRHALNLQDVYEVAIGPAQDSIFTSVGTWLNSRQ